MPQRNMDASRPTAVETAPPRPDASAARLAAGMLLARCEAARQAERDFSPSVGRRFPKERD